MNIKRTIDTLAAAAVISTTVATPALATLAWTGGGTWDYGIKSVFAGVNWSNYHHGSRYHGSSVTGDAGLVRSSCRAPNNWSYSTAYDSNMFRIDQAYWRYC